MARVVSWAQVQADIGDSMADWPIPNEPPPAPCECEWCDLLADLDADVTHGPTLIVKAS